MTVLFDDAAGLEPGDNVLVMGTVQGKVAGLHFFDTPRRAAGIDADMWVEVDLTLNLPIRSYLRRDFRIRIRNANLLGGKVVDVQLGVAHAPLPAETRLAGLAVPDPVEQVSDFITDNRQEIDTALANIRSFTDDLTEFSSSVRRDEGILNTLIYDRDFNREVKGAVARAKDAADKLDEALDRLLNGDGPLAHLIGDSAWSARVEGTLGSLDGAAQDVREVTERVRSGRGALGYAVYSDEGESFLRGIAANVKDISLRIRRGEGILGRLLYDDALADRFGEILDRTGESVSGLLSIVRQVQEGGGTIGLLLYDDDLRLKIRAILDQALIAIEDAREAAPLNSLGSFLFGSF